MQRLIALALLSCAWLGPASAEIRTFVVSNDSDGYGVDRCLATGATCGSVVATAYCRSQNFIEARSFRKVAHDEVTGIGTRAGCRSRCGDYVAIECTR